MTDIFSESTDTSISGLAEGLDPYAEAKQRFTELVKQRRDDAAADIDEDIDNARQQYEYNTRQARNHLWEMNDLKARRQALAQTEETKESQLNDEFDALLRHNRVEAVGIRGEEILIKTVPLDITNPYDSTESYHLGQFEIQFPTMSQRSGNYLRVINRTNARADSRGTEYQHPHIVDENPCFGAIEEQLINALAQGEYSGAFELLLEYLQTYNPDDSYGEHISLWRD